MRALRSAGATAKAAVLALACGAGPAKAEERDLGRHVYDLACAKCHGQSGDGDGPLAAILTVRPSDLTTLTARNEGRFPLLQVIHVIDGRSGVRGHEGPMPPFGALYQDFEAQRIGDYAATLATRGRMLALARYLESLQR